MAREVLVASSEEQKPQSKGHEVLLSFWLVCFSWRLRGVWFSTFRFRLANFTGLTKLSQGPKANFLHQLPVQTGLIITVFVDNRLSSHLRGHCRSVLGLISTFKRLENHRDFVGLWQLRYCKTLCIADAC